MGEAGFQATVAVPPAILDEGHKRGDIQPVVTVRVELDRLAADEQEWLCLIPVVNGLTQMGERLTQVVAGLALGLVGPQQASQCVPTMETVRFNGQIDQQCPCLVGSKAGDWLVIQANLESS